MVFTVLFQRVAVVGGGYIGVELAGVFHALGSHTEYFTRADRPLKDFDDLITSTLLGEMKKQGLLHRPNQVGVVLIVFNHLNHLISFPSHAVGFITL